MCPVSRSPKWIITGCAVTTPLASMKLASVTKSRSRALSCSAIESLEPGHMRPSTKWNAAQFVLHSENASVGNAHTFSRQFTNLGPHLCTQMIVWIRVRSLADSRNLEHRHLAWVEFATSGGSTAMRSAHHGTNCVRRFPSLQSSGA